MLGDFLTRDLKSWGPFPEVPDVSVPSLITLNEHLRAVANIPREIPHLLNGAKVKPLVKQTNTRRRRYSISHVAALGFLVVAGLALISSPVPYVNTNLKYLPLAVCLLSGSLWIGCRILRRKWGNPKWVADFSEYLSNKLSPKQKMAIISEMKALSDQRQPLFCNITYGVPKKVPDVAWVSENWFLLISKNMSWLRGIWLEGETPLHEIYIQSPRNISEGNHNRNLRENELQMDAFKDIKNMRKLKNLISGTLPAGYDFKSNELGVSRKVRFWAIEYFVKNPKLWKELKKNPKAIFCLQNKTHKEAILKEFSNAARNHNTKITPGENMMLEFIELKDRTLENWLRELNWEINKKD